MNRTVQCNLYVFVLVTHFNVYIILRIMYGTVNISKHFITHYEKIYLFFVAFEKLYHFFKLKITL